MDPRSRISDPDQCPDPSVKQNIVITAKIEKSDIIGRSVGRLILINRFICNFLFDDFRVQADFYRENPSLGNQT